MRDVVSTAGSSLYHAAYEAFGGIASETGSGGDRFKFTAREWDANAKLQFNRARWYNPVVGRWGNLDPIGFVSGDFNLYRYGNNAPIILTDPSGLFGGDGYWDFNVSFPVRWGPISIPLGGGVQLQKSPSGEWFIHPYLGIQKPGFPSLSYAPNQKVSPGINAGGGLSSPALPYTTQVGVSSEGPFMEAGATKPSAPTYKKPFDMVNGGIWIVSHNVNLYHPNYWYRLFYQHIEDDPVQTGPSVHYTGPVDTNYEWIEKRDDYVLNNPMNDPSMPPLYKPD